MKMFVWIDKWTPSNKIAVLAETYEHAYDDASHAVKAAMKSGTPEDAERFLRWDQSQYRFDGDKTVLL